MSGDYNTTKAVAARALENGGRKVSPTRIEWKASGNCTEPFTVERFARPSWQNVPDAAGAFLRSVQQFFPGATVSRDGVGKRGKSRDLTITRDGKIPVWLVMEVPCRKCDNCLARRMRYWSIRAVSEFRVAQRTWFGTLTVGPKAMSAALNRARMCVAANQSVDAATGEFLNDDFDKLSPEQRAARLHRQFSPEITRYLKRVRKGALPYELWPWRTVACAMYGVKLICKFRHWEAWETQFRFICVAELGKKTGRLHYHMLMHEQPGTKAVRRALISNQWALGYTDWKLCNSPSQASYVCKYLTKSLLVRVRASKDYGQGVPSSDIAEGVVPTTPTGLLPERPNDSEDGIREVQQAETVVAQVPTEIEER